MSAFFDKYLDYVGNNEVPATYHRWAAISIVGTLLGRNVHIPFGPKDLYPNQYVLLTGGPGARKGTAIEYAQRLLASTGYKYFAPDRNAKEAMWRFMAEQSDTLSGTDTLEELILEPEYSQLFICKDEFVDFTGIGNDELLANLANLWNNLPTFHNPKERAKDIVINKPTINLLGGITPGGIDKYFSGMADEGGFFSRVIFVFGSSDGKRVTWPSDIDTTVAEELKLDLLNIKELQGPLIMDASCRELLELIYTTAPKSMDRRLLYYDTRRFTHLLKLCIILAAMDNTRYLQTGHIILANTILYSTELTMPQALGEYGKARNSDVTNHVLDIIKNADVPVPTRSIWKAVSTDLERYSQLIDILQGLTQSDKIQLVQLPNDTGNGYLPKHVVDNQWKDGLVDFSLLTHDERVYHIP